MIRFFVYFFNIAPPKGIFSDKNIQKGISAADQFRDVMEKRLSKPYTIDADVKINFHTENESKKIRTLIGSTTFEENENRLFDFNTVTAKGHATGTPYFGGGLTRVNEFGGEIINLPTGAQIIPSDKSEKMVEQKQPINVSVVVHGNIFGIDDAVEIIGGRVCDRIVETVNCMA